jgi:DNA polymerase-3 subunit delta'
MLLRLDAVIGHRAATGLLARLIAHDRLPHAILIEGLPGSGRRTIARAVAAGLLCREPQRGNACTRCSSCQLLAAGSHPDLVELSSAALGGESTSVEAVREAIVAAATLSPLVGSRRGFIIPDADALLPAAANALLKTLEEPAPGTVIMLTASQAGGVLGTIRSRVQCFRLQPLTTGDIAAILSRHGVDPGEAQLRAALAYGSPREVWQSAPDPAPIDALLAVVGRPPDVAQVAAVAAFLPRSAAEAGGTLLQEQRRVLTGWCEAAMQRLRRELGGPSAQAAQAVLRIERLLQAVSDLRRNIAPIPVIEALALPPVAGR